MCDVAPEEIENRKDVDEFKRKIRDWEQENCHCKFFCRIAEFIYTTRGILIEQFYAHFNVFMAEL